jgi:hypothetical protein
MRQRLYEIGDVSPELIDYIDHYNLDQKTILANAGILTLVLARLVPVKGGWTFEFDADGIPSAVVEAILFDVEREPYVADLVAWPLHDPHTFATAMGPRGGADVLGALSMPMRGKSPLQVFRTPLQWLQAGCEGCVPLNEDGGRFWLAKAGGPFVVQNLQDGRWMRQLLGKSCSHQSILIPSVLKGDAA